MSSKSSRLNLYASDNISKKSLLVDATDSKTQFLVPDKIELHAPIISLQGNDDTPANIDDLATYLLTEKTTKDAKNTEQDTSISTLQSSLASETVNRESGDVALQNSINAEITARTTADQTLQSNLNEEIAERIASDNALTSSINTEVQDRISAVSSEASARASAIQAETTARVAAVQAVDDKVNAITEGSSVDLDTLIELVNAYQNADTEIINTITSLQTAQTALQAKVDELTSNT